MNIGGTLSVDEFNNILQKIYYQTKYVNNLINNLLHWSMSQINGYNVQNASLNLVELIKNECNLLLILAEEKEIDVKLDFHLSDLKVNSDKSIIQLIFRNLFINAIKFTEKKGIISVELANITDIYEIRIKDNGIGMSSDKLINIHENKIKSTYGTSNEKGTGLGISLCFNFIKLLKGNIIFESEINVGTTAIIQIPKMN